MPHSNEHPPRKAVIHRMVLPEHTCPYGVKAKELLESSGFNVEDHQLTTRAETEALKSELGVKTTPQIFLDGERIGGYDDLKVILNERRPDLLSGP